VASIVSTLSITDQASHLREFLAARKLALSDTAAQNVCRSIELHKPGESKLFGRKLVAALAAHGVVIKHSNALEALARMCGQPNWMRTLQADLPFDAPQERVLYGLLTSKDGEKAGGIQLFPSMSEATDHLLKLLEAAWPTAEAVALATLGIGEQMLMVELEHPTAPWLEFRLCRFAGPGDQTELSNLPPTESRVFCDRLVRTLEYTYPGLLVVNSMRSATLPPHYYLCPEVRRVETGDVLTCWADLELLPVLDSFRALPNAVLVGDVLRFDSDQGPIELKPLWTSNTDQRHVPGGLAPAQLNSLLTRLARLRRMNGGNATQHFGRVMTGVQRAEDVENHFPVNKEALDAALREANLSPKQLALLSGLSLNAVQRIRKYGFAHESAVPLLADALGLASPNALLPPEKQDGIGYRIEDGATFLTALKQTHVWRRIVGDSLQGAELAEVNRIAESLQEYVELLQFSTGPFGKPTDGFEGVEEPVDEERLAVHVQELLDELTSMGVAVVVTSEVRYAGGSGRLESMKGMPLHHGTLFFEKLAALRSPQARSAAST
jgi:hypothetical protein